MEKPTLYSALKNIEGMPKAQRDTFERYRGNSFLEDAIKGEQPLEKACEELAAPFLGWGGQKQFLLPYAKDAVHNAKVEKLGELIPARGLRKRGIYFPDNVITIMGYGVLMGEIGISSEELMSYIGTLANDLPIVMAVGLLGLAIWSFGPIGGGRHINSSLNAANYIDSLIKELEIK